MTLHKPKIIPFSHLFLIKESNRAGDPHSYFIHAIQQLVDQMVPEDLWIQLKSSFNQEGISSVFQELHRRLPLFKYSPIEVSANSVTITYLAPAETTQKMRKQIVEMLSRASGRPVELTGGMSYHFEFQQAPSLKFFVAQEIITIRSREELFSIYKKLPLLIQELQQNLPHQWASNNRVHTLFMPRNEEEVFRNLIDLTKQIKFVQDLPQVRIHFDRQTDGGLSFTVIIARLLKKSTVALKELLEKSSLKIGIDQTRIMGYLKQRYPKESSILHVTLEKEPFFRADDSIDLLKARQKIVAELNVCLGEFRDFNGGMILKQDESFNLLRKEYAIISKDLEMTLENYFYSLRPAVMQTIYEPSVLKKHFDLLLKTARSDSFQIGIDSTEKFLLCFIAGPTDTLKKEVLTAVAQLKIPARELTTCSFEMRNRSFLGFILRKENPATELFETTIRSYQLESISHT